MMENGKVEQKQEGELSSLYLQSPQTSDQVNLFFKPKTFPTLLELGSSKLLMMYFYILLILYIFIHSSGYLYHWLNIYSIYPILVIIRLYIL